LINKDKKNLSQKKISMGLKNIFRIEQKKPSPTATFFLQSIDPMFTIVTNIFPPKGIMQRNKKKFDLFFLPTSNHYSVNNCNKFFPRIFFFNLNECRIHNHNKHKKNYYKVCAMIYILPSWEKNCRFEWHYFPDFSKMEKNSFKKNDLPFHKKPKLSGINSPQTTWHHPHLQKKTLRNYSLPIIITFESWPPPPLIQFYYTFIVYKICFWPVHLTFFQLADFCILHIK